MKFTKIYTILFLAFLPCLLHSQKEKQTAYLQRLSEFRGVYISKEKSDLAKLHNLFQNFSESELQSELVKELFCEVIKCKSIDKMESEVIAETAEGWMHHTQQFYKLMAKDIDLVSANNELVELILSDVVNHEFPFILKRNTSLLKEMEFYDVNQKDIVAEIGAGTGEFSLLLAVLEPEIKLTLNEIGERKNLYIRMKFAVNADYINRKNISIVKGEKTKTNFEENLYDKIIVRNAFHHFKSERKMLRSIHEALNENGILFISEPFLELIVNEDHCKKIMHEQEVVRKIESQGFKLIDSAKLNDWGLLKFAKK